LDVKNPHKLSKLPVACLPVYPNEVRAVGGGPQKLDNVLSSETDPNRRI
jgi:hypothetical protein